MNKIKNISIKKNSLYSVIGSIIPTLVMFMAFPVLINGLGPERFGIYSLANSMSGILAFLDLGLTAATVRLIAKDYAEGNYPAIMQVLCTSFYFYGIIAIFAGGIFFVFAPWIVRLFSLNKELYQESIFAFRAAGLQFGLSLFFNIFLSIPKALQRFDVSSKLMVVLTIGTFGIAVMMVLVGTGLRGVVISNLVVMLVSTLYAARVVRGLLGQKVLFRITPLNLSVFRKMLGYGVYMSINSLATLFITQIQKILVGFFLGPATVTFYTIPFTMASKMHGSVHAATIVMFPLASATRDVDKVKSVYRKMLVGSLLFAFVACVPLFLLSFPILKVWVGMDAARQSARLLSIFAIAYFFLSLTPAPYFLIDGMAHPRVNTIFLSLNAILNIMFILIQYPFGLTLESFGYAFLASNVILSSAYLLFVERLMRRKSHLNVAG